MKKFYITAVLFILFFTDNLLSMPLGINLYPYAFYNSAPVDTQLAQPSLPDYHRYNDQPLLFALFLNLEYGHWTFYAQVELTAHSFNGLKYAGYGNFFLYNPEYGAMIGNDISRLGYIEYSDDFLTFSLGRRPLAFGPGEDDLIVSSRWPFFNHLWLQADFSAWRYHFLFISGDYYAAQSVDRPGGAASEDIGDNRWHKFFMTHSFTYYFWENFYITIYDINLIGGSIPALQDIGPMLLYHGIYNKWQNIMMGLALDGLISDYLRSYFQFVLDDLSYAGEAEAGVGFPTSIGLLGGIQWRINAGRRYRHRMAQQDSHLLRIDNLAFDSGFLLNFEIVWASRYLYNHSPLISRFTNPINNITAGGDGGVVITGYYGAPYGFDYISLRLGLEKNSETYRLTALAEILLRGGTNEERIAGGYGIDDKNDAQWWQLKAPINFTATGAVRLRYALNRSVELLADLALCFSNRFEFLLGLGCGIAVTD